MTSHADGNWWAHLQRNGMTEPFSWDEAAIQYEGVYERALSRR
jgi:glycogen synthase